jgi:AraC-like DNA-binding protein
MNELYNTLSIFVTGGLFLAYGLMFLFASISDNPLLGNYRKARYMMAGAYLFFVSVEIMKYLFGDLSGHKPLPQAISLIISASQSFMFTFAMLALMNTRFPGWRHIFLEAIPALLLIAAVITVYAFCSDACFGIAFYGFAGIYALLLARYSFLFVRSHRQFHRRMENYYSSGETRRLRWIVRSFCAALTIGVTALLSSMFVSTIVVLLFTIVFDVFYTFFAVRFLNYPHLFQTVIEQTVVNETPEEPKLDLGTKSGNDAFALLEKRIELWVADKGFTERGITIDLLSSKLITNSKYLSIYINTHKKQTFRKWINKLRIEEAKLLMLQEPKTSLTEISLRAGFSEKSHFFRQFKEQIGVSPTEWRKIQTPAIFPVRTPAPP